MTISGTRFRDRLPTVKSKIWRDSFRVIAPIDFFDFLTPVAFATVSRNRAPFALMPGFSGTLRFRAEVRSAFVIDISFNVLGYSVVSNQP